MADKTKPKVAKEAPLFEVILRRYEKPYTINKRGICKRICLSLGLLQPGDSRDSMVDVLMVLLEGRASKRWMTAHEVVDAVIKLRQSEGLQLIGIHESNIRRQLRRLRELMLVERHRARYRIAENQSLCQLFQEKVEKFLIPQAIERIKDYLKMADEQF